MLFLKYLDDLEHEKPLEAELMGEDYRYIIAQDYRWGTWAAPKNAEGEFDHNNALTGDDLMEFVEGELFPYLKGFKKRAESADTIEYKIGEIFGEIKNKIQSGYSLRDELEKVDELRFSFPRRKTRAIAPLRNQKQQRSYRMSEHNTFLIDYHFD